MENLVDKIIEIDKIAEEKMKVAEKENAAFMRQIDQRKQEIINEIDKSAEAKLKSFEKAEKSSADEEIAKLEQEKQQAIQKLQAIYQDHHEQWTDELVNRILKQ